MKSKKSPKWKISSRTSNMTKRRKNYFPHIPNSKDSTRRQDVEYFLCGGVALIKFCIQIPGSIWMRWTCHILKGSEKGSWWGSRKNSWEKYYSLYYNEINLFSQESRKVGFQWMMLMEINTSNLVFYPEPEWSVRYIGTTSMRYLSKSVAQRSCLWRKTYWKMGRSKISGNALLGQKKASAGCRDSRKTCLNTDSNRTIVSTKTNIFI